MIWNQGLRDGSRFKNNLTPLSPSRDGKGKQMKWRTCQAVGGKELGEVKIKKIKKMADFRWKNKFLEDCKVLEIKTKKWAGTEACPYEYETKRIDRFVPSSSEDWMMLRCF